jgi:hypothetical protein
LSLRSEKIEVNFFPDCHPLGLFNWKTKTSHTYVEHARKAIVLLAIPKYPQVRWPGDPRGKSPRRILTRQHSVTLQFMPGGRRRIKKQSEESIAFARTKTN